MEHNEINHIEEQQPASLRSFLFVLFKRKKIIITFFLAVVGVVTIGSFLMPKIYKAESKILVEKEVDSEKALLFRMNFPQGYEKYDFVNAEMEIMQSYPVISDIVKKFRLDTLGQTDQPLPEEEKENNFARAIKNFQESIEVENPKNSNIITISYESKDPRLAADVVNTFLQTYIAYRSEISSESEGYKFLEDQMLIADKKLGALEQHQADFKEQKEIGSPEAQRVILLTRLTDYEKSLTEAKTKRIGKEAKLAVIIEQLKEGNDISIPSTESSDSPSREKYIAKLKGELLDMELRRGQLLQKFTPQYEEVVNLNNQIEATKTKIENEIQQIVRMEQTAVRALAAEERVLQNSIDQIKTELREFAQTEYEFTQISRGIDDNRDIYSMLLKQREEARLSLAKLERGVKIKVVSPAVAPREPVRPKKMLNIVLALFLGITGGLGLAFFMEYFDHTINTPDDLEKYTGIPVLGSVREINGRMSNGKAGSRQWAVSSE